MVELSHVLKRDHLCYSCIYVEQDFIQKPTTFCVANLSTTFVKLTVFLRKSCDCNYSASRGILAPQPGWSDLFWHDDRQFVKLILLQTFVGLSVSRFFLYNQFHSVVLFPLIRWFCGYFLLITGSVFLVSLSLICHHICVNLECTVATIPDLTCILSCTVFDVQRLAVYLSI